MDDQRPAILLEEHFAEWKWARGYVEDVSHAVALIATSQGDGCQIYNVAYPEAMTQSDWVRQIARVVGWKGEIVSRENDSLPHSLRNEDYDLSQQYAVDSSLIRKKLGYDEVVDFDEALARTIEWERSNPPKEIAPGDFDYKKEDAALLD